MRVSRRFTFQPLVAQRGRNPLNFFLIRWSMNGAPASLRSGHKKREECQSKTR